MTGRVTVGVRYLRPSVREEDGPTAECRIETDFDWPLDSWSPDPTEWIATTAAMIPADATEVEWRAKVRR